VSGTAQAPPSSAPLAPTLAQPSSRRAQPTHATGGRERGGVGRQQRARSGAGRAALDADRRCVTRSAGEWRGWVTDAGGVSLSFLIS
jgi:hypothetical protein